MADAYRCLLGGDATAGKLLAAIAHTSSGVFRSRMSSQQMTTSRRKKYSFIDIPGTGMRLAYKEWTSSKSQKVIILLHDAGSCGSLWNHVAEQLCEAGYRVFAIDQRGHGRSTHSKTYSCDVMVKDIHGFIVEKDLYVRPVCLLGMGMGAVIALALAHASPKLVGAVGALEPGVLIDNSSEVQDNNQPWICRWLGQEGMVYGISDLASWLASPLSALGPRLATYCVEKQPDTTDTYFRKWMENATGKLQECLYLAEDLLREDTVKSIHVTRMDPSFEFKFNVDAFQEILKSLEMHVLFAFGEFSTMSSRQDICVMSSMCVSASSVTVEEMPMQGNRFVRDDPDSTCDLILDFLLDAASGCFEVPKRDAWSRTPANLGLRPLPEYATIEEAAKALGPRRIPTKDDIEQALRKLRVEEGRNEEDLSDDELEDPHGRTGSKTALSADPMDYFGFVG
jgi:pimeloyl-ACP methyl ester carboxylesterase